MNTKKTSFIFKNVFLIFFSILVVLLFLKVGINQNKNKFDTLNVLHNVIRLIDTKYVEEPDMNLLIEGAISGMLNKLDPHSIYINKSDYQQTSEDMEGEFEGIGVEFSIIDDYITVITPIVDGPAYQAGIKSGDKIVKINGESAYQITTADVLKKLKGPKGTEVEVTIQRMGLEEFKRILIRDKIPLKSIPSYFMLDHNIGYIKLSKFSKKTFEEFSDSYNVLESRGMQKLLLDLRDNPGGLLDQAISILDMFISSNDTLLYTKGRIPNANTVIRAQKNLIDKKIPIIAIINRGSASASEIIAGTFQDLDRGLVIGETSFGKGSVQQHYDLNDSTATRITVAKFYTPSGRSIQRNYYTGADEYYLNININNREINDSLKTTLPQFKTRKGRIVYGGGGITPDIYFQDTTLLSKQLVALIYNPKRPIFNYTESVKETYTKYADYYEFKKQAEVLIKEKIFIEWLKESGYDYENDQETGEWIYLKNRIIAELANKVFDRNSYYKTIIMNDKVVLESLNYFDEAKTLLN